LYSNNLIVLSGILFLIVSICTYFIPR
jgi:hypothetical protein